MINKIILLKPGFRSDQDPSAGGDYHLSCVDSLIQLIKNPGVHGSSDRYFFITCEHFFTNELGTVVPYIFYEKKMGELRSAIKNGKNIACFVHSYVYREAKETAALSFDQKTQKDASLWNQASEDDFYPWWPDDVEENPEVRKNLLPLIGKFDLNFSVTNGLVSDTIAEYLAFKTNLALAQSVPEPKCVYTKNEYLLKGKQPYYFNGYPSPLVFFNGSISFKEKYWLRVCADSSLFPRGLLESFAFHSEPAPSFVINQSDTVFPGGGDGIITNLVSSPALYSQIPNAQDARWPDSMTIENIEGLVPSLQRDLLEAYSQSRYIIFAANECYLPDMKTPTAGAIYKTLQKDSSTVTFKRVDVKKRMLVEKHIAYDIYDLEF